MSKGGGYKYQMETKNGKTIYLQAVTMIDPVIVWIEICTVPSARSDLISNVVELSWLIRYPLPNKVKVNRRNDLLAGFKPITVLK